MKLMTFAVSVIIITTMNLTAKDNTFLFQPDGANFYVYGQGRNSFIINQSKITSMKIDSLISGLSSGKRINTASDDPAGFAVAEKMKGLLNQLRQETMNDEDMRNLYGFIESSIAEDQEMLQRIRTLLVQASSGILNKEDRGYIQTEISQFLDQINLNAKFLQFNNMSVITELTTQNLGLDKVDVVHNLQNSFQIVDDALTKLTVKRVLQGVKSNVLTFRIEGKSYQYLNLQKTESGISDLDMTEAITDLIKDSVQLKTRYGLILRSK